MSYYDLWVFPSKYPLTKLADQNIYGYKGLWVIRCMGHEVFDCIKSSKDLDLSSLIVFPKLRRKLAV